MKFGDITIGVSAAVNTRPTALERLPKGSGRRGLRGRGAHHRTATGLVDSNL